MKPGLAISSLASVALTSCAAVLLAAQASQKQATPQLAGAFATEFPVDKARLLSVGTARYFVLQPGAKSTFEGGATRLVITVLEATEKVDGVVTRVVEERETEGGTLIEVSRNFFAFDPRDSAVYYFGEDVDMYRDGKITGHEGSWRSGVNGARFGLMMPGRPTVGTKYHQEVAPKVAMDRAEVTSVGDALKTPSGSYTSCVHTRETTPLEPGTVEWKRYCPGVGLAEDGELKLTQFTPRP